jgi:hypothetical protein
MKMNRSLLLVGGLVIALAGVIAAAESPGDFDRWWTPQNDAVVAAPDNHKVVFENDEVRVLEVTVPPHTREPLHVHRYPAVIYLQSSPHMIEHLADGTSHDAGDRPDGLVRYLPIAQGHFLENVDSKPLKAIRVELKKER